MRQMPINRNSERVPKTDLRHYTMKKISPELKNKTVRKCQLSRAISPRKLMACRFCMVTSIVTEPLSNTFILKLQ